MSAMEIADHIDALKHDGGELAEAASQAGLDALVPSCDPWRVRDLLRHIGYVHRWAARHVTEQPEKVIDSPSEADILNAGAPDTELIEWFRDGYQALVATLQTADPGANYAFFLRNASSPLAFWARRQAHETAIHRADAQLAAGQTSEYKPGFAADGIDELIMGFAARSRRPPQDALGRSMLVRTTDTKDAWRVTWPAATGNRAACERMNTDNVSADCVLTGSAASLYLFLWNRSTKDVAIHPDATAWRDGFQVRWE
jgi:uncharacterized protein (TIGR03083 family)